MTTFCTGGVKCVSQTSFCLSSLYPLRTAVSAWAWSMGVCVHFTDWSQASFFQPWFPPRAKPVRVSNIVNSRHSANYTSSPPETVTMWIRLYFVFDVFWGNFGISFQLIRIIATSRWKLTRYVWSWVVLSHGIGWCLWGGSQLLSRRAHSSDVFVFFVLSPS